MRGSIFLFAVLARLSVASPIQKRDLIQASGWSESYVNGEKVVTSWTTQYDDGAAVPSPTQAALSAPPAATPAAPTSAPTAPAAPSSGGSNSYESSILAAHNSARADHSASPLEWDDDLATWAQQIGQSCVWAHDMTAGDGHYGQNIAAGYAPADAAKAITDMYTSEMPLYKNNYGVANPDFTQGWGHFTQIVWKATTKVGCATVDCSAHGLANTNSGIPPWFTVCNYKAQGNFAGQYAQNVGPPLS